MLIDARARSLTITAFRGNEAELLRLARESGVRISIGSDAHATDQLAALDYGIAAARLADIPAERIVNCMSADDLIAWTRRSSATG